ncbi:WD40 repeat-like protein [Rhizopogon salebrosus TDB-379]|nr:WD40 repeat-like protein [Rhizopogon salebrosus TDB-379]
MVLLWWGTRRQARGDEEKIEPSVHVLRFEIKMMRHREAHNESSPDWMLMGEAFYPDMIERSCVKRRIRISAASWNPCVPYLLSSPVLAGLTPSEIANQPVNTWDDSPKRAMASGSHAQSTLPNAPLPETSTTPTPKHRFKGHQNSIEDAVFLHDNVHIVSGSLDGTMRKWDCDTGLLVGKPWKGEGRSISALALSPDGRTIACGREDGSVQRWNTDGEMIEGVWTGHSGIVLSLSWSPRGSHLASGSEDGTILIRKTKSGEVAVGPIQTDQNWVRSLAYSPSGDRIASGGGNGTICIWDSNTGKLLVGPIKNLGTTVTSVVWSSDGSKLYSASDRSARVFDSVSGTLLHRFPHNSPLWSVALSPKHNVLACVGHQGVAQLWDTESYEPLGHSFRQDGDTYFVSFSPDGRYLACGGDDNKITLWIVQDIAPQLIPTSTTRHPVGNAQEETESPSSSCLDVDATKSAVNEGCDDPYSNDFFEVKLVFYHVRALALTITTR